MMRTQRACLRLTIRCGRRGWVGFLKNSPLTKNVSWVSSVQEMCMSKGEGRVCMFFSVLILDFQILPPFFQRVIF